MTRKMNWLRIWLRLTAVATGMLIVGPLAGCKASVTAAFYTGLEDLAVSLVKTFFEAITPTTTTTASAQGLIDSIQQWLA
jgi:hypothetical protein